jgi:hypothetical protein
MSRINIRDLFSGKKDNSSTQSVAESDPSPAEGVSILSLNKLTPIPEWSSATSDNVKFQIERDDNVSQLPDFFSDVSTVSLLSGSVGSGRIVASSGPFLCLGRGDSLWIIDITTGMSNDRSVSCIKNPIRDMELFGSYLLFTDGIDVGVIKITGTNGNNVGLIGSVYLSNVGTVSDPIVSVQWHPTSSPSFVTVRASSGWSLWDMVRLQSKSVPRQPETDGIDLLGSDQKSAEVPSLFKSIVENPLSVSEGVHAWSSASNVIAGKKLSPGVLAILKRGGDNSPERRSTPLVFKAFTFSSDGSLAVAALEDGFKVWTIGHRCSAVSFLASGPSEEEWKRITNGRDIRGLVSVDANKFILCTDQEIGIVSIEKSASHLRTISFGSSVELTCITRIGRQNLVIVAGKSFSKSLMILLNESSICVTTLPQESVCCLATSSTVGNPNQIAIYAAGRTGGDEPGTMWTAQTLDLEEQRFEKQERVERLGSFEQISSEMVEASPLNEEPEDDFPHSDASSIGAPDRLESAVGLTQRKPTEEDLNAIKSEIFQTVTDDIIRVIQDEIAGQLKERLAKQQRDLQSHMDKESRRVESMIEKTVKEKFTAGIRRAFEEIGNQIESRMVDKLDRIIQQAKEKEEAMSRQIDDLIAATEAAIQRVSEKRNVGPGEPAALVEIRRYINSGDHLQAISTATQWWKLNQPVAQGQPDLLAITCAAIASQVREGEPIRDIPSGCYMLLVLTEWTKLNSGAHADRTVAVLRAAKFVVSCLFSSPINIAGNSETVDLCYKSLSKSVRNAAAIIGTGDRTVDELSREVLSDIREYMMRFSGSRVSTPRATTTQPGATILQMLRRQ